MISMESAGIVTPAYVFDTDELHAQVRRIRAAAGRAKLCYAIKANPFLIEDLIEYVDAFEACSPGEYELCERLGVPEDKLVLSGVFKAEEDVRHAVRRYRGAVFTAESPSQLALLCRMAEEFDQKLNVLLRLSGGNQFGMDEATLTEILRGGARLPVTIVGIQYYGGTQKRADAIGGEFASVCAFAERAKAMRPSLRRVEYGPGLRVDYFLGEDSQKLSLQALEQALRDAPDSFEIVLEIGRFLVADCGTYYTRIVDLKHTGQTSYCIVDGGIHQLKYYGQTMAMKVPYVQHFPRRAAQERAERWTVCGSLCTAADVLVKDLPLFDARVGDVLAFQKTGAYSVTEGIGLFLSRPLPRVYLRSRGECRLLRDFIPTSNINQKGEF